MDGDSPRPRITAGGDAKTAVAAERYAMWKHQAGRIDFEEPLFELFERGWRFQEFAPTVGAGRWLLGRHRVSALGAGAGRPARAKGSVGRARASRTESRCQAQAFPGWSQGRHHAKLA